ncbi:MAG: nucleotidyltransferase family protein [Actinomycetota bacterium]
MSDKSARRLVEEIAGFGLPRPETDSRIAQVPEHLWPYALGSLASQRLTGIALEAFYQEAVTLSDEQAEQLLARHRDLMLHALGLERALLHIAAGLDEAEIEFLVLKGAALAHTRYPNASWRPFGDVDLLVRGGDFARAGKVLESLGHRRRLPEPAAGFDEKFGKGAEYRNDAGTEVDLHRTLTLGPFGLWIEPGELFDRSSTFALGGRVLRRLGDADLLLHACIHAALGWYPPLLLPIRDVAQTAAGPVDWTLVAELVRRWRLAVVLRHAFELQTRTLDCPPPHELALDGLEPGRGEQKALEAYVSARRWRGATEISSIRAISGLSNKASYVRALLLPSAEFLAARTRGRHARPLAARWNGFARKMARRRR